MRTRALLISVIAVVAVVGGAVMMAVGERQADDAMARVRVRADATTVSGADVLGAMYAADGALARKLGVDPTETALSSRGADGWCVTVTLRRMTAVREAAFLARPGEALVPSPSC